MRGALCVVTRLYILYLAADESISGWEFLLLIPKSPQLLHTMGKETLKVYYGIQFITPEDEGTLDEIIRALGSK